MLEAIKNRRSVRDYKADLISDDDLKEIIKAGQFAPTSMDNRAVEFIVIRDQKIKQEMFEIVEQDFIIEAPVLLALVTNTDKTTNPVQDLSIASTNIMLQAASMSLGTVWKNIRPNPAEAIKTLLNIPPDFMLINLIPIGYPKAKPEPHIDAEFNPKKIHQDKW